MWVSVLEHDCQPPGSAHTDPVIERAGIGSIWQCSQEGCGKMYELTAKEQGLATWRAVSPDELMSDLQPYDSVPPVAPPHMQVDGVYPPPPPVYWDGSDFRIVWRSEYGKEPGVYVAETRDDIAGNEDAPVVEMIGKPYPW